MIESRYKIEYIFPDEDTKKTSPLRALLLLPLVPILALVVLNVTHDYSLKDLSHDSLALINNAKEKFLDLGGRQELVQQNTVQNISQSTNKDQILKTNIEVVSNTPKPIVSEISNEDKETMSDMRTTQKIQLETIQTQLSKNTNLSNNLDEISKQLSVEKDKNQKLNTELAQQKNNKEKLEQQLNSIIKTSSEKAADLDQSSSINKQPTLAKTTIKAVASSTKVLNNIKVATKQDTPKQTIPKQIASTNEPIVQEKTHLTITNPDKVNNATDKPKAIKDDAKTADSPKIKIENTKEVKVEPSNTNKSAVDDIIAAMQAPQKKSENQTSEKQVDAKK